MDDTTIETAQCLYYGSSSRPRSFNPPTGTDQRMPDVVASDNFGRNRRPHRQAALTKCSTTTKAGHSLGITQNQPFQTSLAPDTQPITILLEILDYNNLQCLCGFDKWHTTGPWTAQYETVRQWHWQLAPTGRLLNQAHDGARPQAAIPTRQHQTQLMFSLTVPTNQEFLGPPVTPFDQYQQCV